MACVPDWAYSGVMGFHPCSMASLVCGGFLIIAMIITSPMVGVFVVKPALRGEHPDLC